VSAIACPENWMDELVMESSAAHGDPVAPVILGVTGILAFAIIGRIAARRLGQPTVLGEVLVGILLGNIAWYMGVDLITLLREGPRVFDIAHQTMAGAPLDQVAAITFGAEKGAELAAIVRGPAGGELIQVAHTVDIFSRYGIIFMLFMVGLGTNLDEMRSVGRDSVRVAIIGVVVPVALGFGAEVLLRPDLSLHSSMFVAATLAATSIGISASVLEEAGATRTREGRIILGAAVGDDILGLILLAVVSGIVVSGSVDVTELVTIVVVSTLFLALAALLGPYVVRASAKLMRSFDIVEAKMFTSYLFVMVLAWMANLAGLATIIGAFAAGVLLQDGFFKEHNEHSNGGRIVTIRELIMPLEVIMVPIFFVLMGIQVKIESLTSWPVITLAAGLLIAAVIGKLVSGLGAARGTSWLVIGIGMLPRGEVGLVFAAIGRTLGVIDDGIFSAIVLMVMVTTLAAPPWLKHQLAREKLASETPAP
jgi:Kef-type K+ transport system membrane component KefB